MKCRSGQHYWTDPVSAGRCCHPEWQRAIRLISNYSDLDPAGRTFSKDFVHGWVRRQTQVTRTKPGKRIMSRLYPHVRQEN